MSVCRHELGVHPSQPPAIPTLDITRVKFGLRHPKRIEWGRSTAQRVILLNFAINLTGLSAEI